MNVPRRPGLDATRPLAIAVLAMGGQGGGVLVDWIVALCEAQGWVAQSTSVPGVAQRTGATVYYIEALPLPPDAPAGLRPVLSLMAVPGEITFSKDGIHYNLAAFKAGRALQLVFSDATSGDSTYSVGRFLFVAPNADGTITLDFNRAVLPPCAFSYAFNCPMPPRQNRFTVPIEAGEKQVLNKDGSLLHE